MARYRPVDPRQSFPELEQRVLERWRERDVFHRSLAQREGAPTWSFYEGPPTANGRPSVAHVLSRTFKDIYPRFRTMRGYRVPRKAGWDTHGLPVELEVERELGINAKADIEAYGIAEFNARCRESVFRYVEEWNRLTERIGFWIDLDDPYVTLDNTYIESVWWSLRRIWDDGRLYESNRVVPYCPRDQTALSSHEVAMGYKNVEDPSVYVKLSVTEVPPRTRRSRSAPRSSTCGPDLATRCTWWPRTWSSGCSEKTPRSSRASRARRSPGRATSRRSPTSPTTGPAGTPCSRPTS